MVESHESSNENRRQEPGERGHSKQLDGGEDEFPVNPPHDPISVNGNQSTVEFDKVDSLGDHVTVRESTVNADPPPTTPVDGGSLRRDTTLRSAGGRIGNYLILGEIARGGMGVIYKARQEPVDRVVALKMILSGQHASDQQIKRFYSEAQASAKLNHPSIVPIYEVGQLDGCPYFSMEFIDGDSLADKIRDRPLTSRQAAEYLQELAEAIAYAHDSGVLHRDIKPSNVLINGQNRVKITDFGLAKQVENESELTASGAILGTPSYMPPEQAIGDKSAVTVASDIYSLGATLYALLTSRPPFQAPSTSQTMMQVIEGVPVPPRQLNASIDPDLETICLKCLAKVPHLRYASAQHLANDLRRYLHGETILARRVTLYEKSWRWCRRNPIPTALAGAILFGIVALFSAIVMNARSQRITRMAELEHRFEARLDTPSLSPDYPR